MKIVNLIRLLLLLLIAGLLTNCGSIEEPKEYAASELANDTIALAPAAAYMAYYDTVLTAAGLHWPTVADSATSTYTSASKQFFQLTGLLYSTANGVHMPGAYKGAGKCYEGLVGNMVTDAMLYNAKKLVPECLFFYSNLGGVRDDKASGSYLTATNYAIVPGAEINSAIQTGIFFYANFIEVLKIKGANMVDMFEHGVRSWTDTSTIGSTGKFPQISGVKVEYDRSLIAYPTTGYGRVLKLSLSNRTDTAVWDYNYSDSTQWNVVYDVNDTPHWTAAGVKGWLNGYTADSQFVMGTSNYLAMGGDDYTMLYYAKQYQNAYLNTDVRAMGQVFGLYLTAYKQAKGASSTLMPTMQNRIKFIK